MGDSISLKMWIFIILGTLILGVVIDAVRRVIHHQRNPYRLNLDKSLMPTEDVADPLRHEFPSGGARPVDLGQFKHSSQENERASIQANQTKATSLVSAPIQVTEVAVKISSEVVTPIKEKESFFSRKSKVKTVDAEGVAPPEKTLSRAQKAQIKQEQLNFDESVPVLMEPIDFAGEQDSSSDDLSEQDETLNHIEPLFESNDANSSDEQQIKNAEQVVTLNVFSNAELDFKGAQLLELLLASGLRYGEMNIFHRHQMPTGEGKVLFSVANAVNPGTFNITNMDKFSTKGVSFFFPLPGPNKPMDTFDLMLDTAQFIAKKLGGDVKDDQRTTIRPQTIEHYRQRIRDFERRQVK